MKFCDFYRILHESLFKSAPNTVSNEPKNMNEFNFIFHCLILKNWLNFSQYLRIRQPRIWIVFVQLSCKIQKLLKSSLLLFIAYLIKSNFGGDFTAKIASLSPIITGFTIAILALNSEEDLINSNLIPLPHGEKHYCYFKVRKKTY